MAGPGDMMREQPPGPPAPPPGPRDAAGAPPAQAAQAQGPAGQAPGKGVGGNTGWNKPYDEQWTHQLRNRLLKSGMVQESEISEGALQDPKHRQYLNQKLKEWGQNQQKQGQPQEPATGGPDPGPEAPGEETPPATGGVDPGPGAPGPEAPGAPGAAGGWMPGQQAVPWGGGGRTNWGQGPQGSQGRPGSAGYPGSPSYPGPGQSFPLPGQPGGPVAAQPWQQNNPSFLPIDPSRQNPGMPPAPGMPPGPGMPPPGRGYPGRAGAPMPGQWPPPGPQGFPGPGQQNPGQWPPSGPQGFPGPNTEWRQQQQQEQKPKGKRGQRLQDMPQGPGDWTTVDPRQAYDAQVNRRQ